MKDITGRELEAGQRVVFSVGTALKTGIVAYIGEKASYGTSFPRCKILLEKPEPRFKQGHWLRDANGRYVQDPETGMGTYVNGEEKRPLTHRDIYEEKRICILDPLTNEDKGVE